MFFSAPPGLSLRRQWATRAVRLRHRAGAFVRSGDASINPESRAALRNCRSIGLDLLRPMRDVSA